MTARGKAKGADAKLEAQAKAIYRALFERKQRCQVHRRGDAHTLAYAVSAPQATIERAILRVLKEGK